MITINNNKYNTISYEIHLSDFYYSWFENGQKKIKKGISPYISFNYNNKIDISFETIYSIDEFKKMNVSTEIDFTKYISDILFNDGRGWYSMGNQKFKCTLIKKTKNIYIIDIDIISNEFEDLEINLYEEFKL